MKQEDIELLLKELCTRLPHGVKVNLNLNDNIYYFTGIYSFKVCVLSVDNEDNVYTTVGINCIKPYLFPLSSMTDEQKTLWDYIDNYADHHEAVDWLNKNHFDYRGLIDMGLAIDATNKNIY